MITSSPWLASENTSTAIPESQGTRLLGRLFSEVGENWTARPGFAGAGFTRIVMELADLPGHPARAVAHRHKAAVELWYAELFSKAKVGLANGSRTASRAARRGRNSADPHPR